MKIGTFTAVLCLSLIAAPSVSVGGEIAATLRGFIDEFGEGADSDGWGIYFPVNSTLERKPPPR